MAKSKNENKIKVKIALAEKYERLINLSGGRKKKDTFLNRARHYRQQAAELGRE